MKAGGWHQCCHNSQNLVAEQLLNNVGVGAILSPTNVSKKNLQMYAQKYKDAGGDILIDHQFYVPEYTNKNLKTYELSAFRPRDSTLAAISDSTLDLVATELYHIHEAIAADGVIAPALAYQAGRPDINRFNSRSFEAAKRVGDTLGVPTYASVIIGNSIASSENLVEDLMSEVTSFNADGFFYGFDFGKTERIPSDTNLVKRALSAGLTLACTGKPVIHAFSGPMGLLSFGFGAKAACIGHFQTIWQFDPENWSQKPPGGGSGPPRFFSESLWGTIVYPDELTALPNDLQKEIATHSSFSEPVSKGLGVWTNWDSHKHLLELVTKRYDSLATYPTARDAAQSILLTLEKAGDIHQAIQQKGIVLKDRTFSYQRNWHKALTSLLKERASDFDYLELVQ